MNAPTRSSIIFIFGMGRSGTSALAGMLALCGGRLPDVPQIYTALSAAARDEPLETAVLDDTFSSFRASEHAFRVALDDYRARFASIEVERRPTSPD